MQEKPDPVVALQESQRMGSFIQTNDPVAVRRNGLALTITAVGPALLCCAPAALIHIRRLAAAANHRVVPLQP